MTIRVAINGFGRIGRGVLRAIVESGRTDIQVVGINDLAPAETNAHLFKYDSVHGRFNGEVKVEGDTIDVGTGPIKVTSERNPTLLLCHHCLPIAFLLNRCMTYYGGMSGRQIIQVRIALTFVV